MEEGLESKNGLSRILSRRRRHRKDRDSSSNSIVSTGTESDGHHGVRDAIEGAIEKLKSSPTDERGEVNGLKKLVHKGMGSRRRRTKLEREEEERVKMAAARGRSVAERGTLENESSSLNENGGLAVNRSWSGDGSSLLTYDSDPDSSFDTPPPLSTHPSHLEFLTTSSPLIQSTIFPTEPAPQLRPGGATPRSALISNSSDKLATSEPAPAAGTNSLRAPTDGSHRRSPSPVGRLKGAFRPNRKDSSLQSSPERKAGGATVEPPHSDKNKDKDKEKSDVQHGTVASSIGSASPSRASTPSRAATEPAHTPHVQPIDTSRPPRTPPRTESAPLIVNTPPTPTDSSVPQFPSASDRGTPSSVASNPNVITSPSGNMISHRRVRSTSTTLGPSKLSSITSAPLTPTPENRSITPSNPTGFFNTMFSAAQNAANSLTTSIANTSLVPGGRHRSGTQEIKEVENPEVETLRETLGETSESDEQVEEKEPAVKTLGMGDLSLSHLGITENSGGAETPMATTRQGESRGRSESKDADPLSNSNVFAQSNTMVEATDPAAASQVEDTQTTGRPRSVQEPSMVEVETPPNGSVFEGKGGIYRSGSIRSKRHRRTRGSSATTGTAIGAAIAAANASVAHPTANGSTPKITGFAVASKKRNRDFHQLFRSVPDDDYLIEDYSCALQREILAHGRLYVSEGHLCFSSNIFGWVTTLVMSFDEIVSVEKRSTALVFKNGLVISTLHAKNIFASFTSRDSTYDLIVGIWKLGHPSLRSSLNGVRIDETGGGDKTEKVDGNGASLTGSDSESEGDEGDEVYDEDEEERDSMSLSRAEGSVAGSDVAEKVVGRKPSNIVAPTNGTTAEKKDEGSATFGGDFPGPATHAATDCADGDSHYSKVIADEVIPAPLGKVYSLMFGPASTTWLKNWLTVDQKSLELTMDDKKHLSLDNKIRVYSYIKPLSGSSFAPKQTRCISTETLDALDLEKAVSVTISTQTPDVPSGNVFSTKTKYCLTWAEGNSTRIQMNCAIEWTGKSWLKGPIEKGANDGQVQYASDIVAALKVTIASRRGAITASAGKKGKKTRKARGSKSELQAVEGALDTKAKTESWGVFEPLRPIFGPVVGIINSLATGNMMYGLLVGLLVASWFRFGGSSIGKGGDTGWIGSADRIAAYEEIWRREETELWDWLEHRAGMDTLRDAARMQSEARVISDRLKEVKMQSREMDDAIRVTEEKLRLFKAVVQKDKAKKQGRKEVPKMSSTSEPATELKA